jgi:hypothetical protein
MATPIQVRQVGLELKDNITAFKTGVDAINTVVSAWTLDGADGALPAEAVVKAQLAAYDALSKPNNSLNDALAAIREVV